MTTRSALEYTMFAHVFLLRNWCEQRPSKQVSWTLVSGGDVEVVYNAEFSPVAGSFFVQCCVIVWGLRFVQ